MRPTGAGKAADTLEALRRNILDGTWPVNSRIPKEAELMEIFGVGKSTVREAVRSLATIGMLEPIKGVGTFVRSLTPVSSMLTQFVSGYSFDQILVYRRALEIEAAQQAAVNRSDEQLELLRASFENDREADPCAPATPSRGKMPGSFHFLIFEAAGNPLMSSMFAGVMGGVRQAMRSGELVYGVEHGVRHFDHGLLLDAIATQDVAAAAHAMAMHVDRDLIVYDALDERLQREVAGVSATGDGVRNRSAARPQPRAALLAQQRVNAANALDERFIAERVAEA